VGRESAHYIALTCPAKITTNFRPNFKHENGNKKITITAAKVEVKREQSLTRLDFPLGQQMKSGLLGS
jgi:hypothetical protein